MWRGVGSNNSAPTGGLGGGWGSPPPMDPPPPSPPKDWAKSSSGHSANQTFSLAPSVGISLDQRFSSALSAPLKTQQCNDPRNNQQSPQYANYWAPLTRTRHIPPQSVQPRHTDHWAPRTRKRHQQEHRPQRPTERSDPTQHAKGRTGDCPGPLKETTARRNVTRGGWTPLLKGSLASAGHCSLTLWMPPHLRHGARPPGEPLPERWFAIS